MGRKQSVVVGTFAILLLVALAFTLGPLRPGEGSGESRSSDALSAREIASLPAIAASKPAGESGARTEAAAAPAVAPRAGRVRVADGGPIPKGTRVVVRLDNP